MAVLRLTEHELAQFPPLAVEFSTYKTVIEGRTEKTVCEYLTDLRTFFRYLKAVKTGIDLGDEESFRNLSIQDIGIEELRQVNAECIYRFLFYVDRRRGNNACTKSRKLSALKSFFRFLTVKKGLLDKNPTADIEGPKLRKKLPKYMSLEESIQLLQSVQQDQESKTRQRDYAILTLFLNCGMRLSELTGINLEDIDKDMRSLRVTGKGQKQRIVYLNDACRSAISAYLPVRNADPEKSITEHALFLSGRHTRISNKTVQWLVNKYLGTAGLSNRGLSVHKLRHTAATLMYQTGHVDVRVLKDILGHEQLNTTQIYTHLADSQMEEAMQQNPLAGLTVKPSRSGKTDPDKSGH